MLFNNFLKVKVLNVNMCVYVRDFWFVISAYLIRKLKFILLNNLQSYL